MRPILCALTLAFAATPALASPFDGKWLADIPAQGNCKATATMTLMVADGTIIGEVQNPGNVVPIAGTVDDKGNATFTAQQHYPGTMKFTAQHFDATWFNGACNRHAAGDRALDETQQAAAAEQRKQHQATLAEMIRLAESGGKVSYAALRAETIYAEDWDFYGNRINGLINQALAASQGKDCETVLEKAEEVIKLDFTVIDAHQLRADCLEDSDRAKSRIEQKIADGLWDSLTDSGDGESEKTAFVVATWHDEARLLTKYLKLQQRASQTTVRGSNGRYYDIIQAGTPQRVRTVFFDVSLYIAGRDSKRAAVATVSVH